MEIPILSTWEFQLLSMGMSASAKQRGITPQLFDAWELTQERSVTACPTCSCVTLDSVVHQRQHFEFDTAIMRQSVMLSSCQQFVDRILC